MQHIDRDKKVPGKLGQLPYKMFTFDYKYCRNSAHSNSSSIPRNTMIEINGSRGQLGLVPYKMITFVFNYCRDNAHSNASSIPRNTLIEISGSRGKLGEILEKMYKGSILSQHEVSAALREYNQIQIRLADLQRLEDRMKVHADCSFQHNVQAKCNTISHLIELYGTVYGVSSDLDGCRGAFKSEVFFPLCSCLNL